MVSSSFYDKDISYGVNKVVNNALRNSHCYNKHSLFINYRTNRHKRGILISDKDYSLYSRYSLKGY